MTVVLDRLTPQIVVSGFPGFQFGEGTAPPDIYNNYVAQTFRAGGNLLHSVEVAVDPTFGPDNLEFRVLITTVVTTANGFHPGAVLYESATIVVPQDGDSALSVLKVDLGALALTKGVTYAIVLDAKVTADFQVGKGTVGFSYLAGTGGTNYTDGFLAYLQGSGTRAENFAGDWVDSASADLAFRLVFTSPGVTITGTKGNNVVDAIRTPPGQPLPTENDDFISGLGGRDKLFGLGGEDTLDGGKDKDQLTGGAGGDLFLFSAGLKSNPADKVMDFVAVDDTILLAISKFKGLAQGAVSDAAFRDIGEAASDADRIIYKASGKLLADKDGKGGDDPHAFAKLVGAPDIGAADFLVV